MRYLENNQDFLAKITRRMAERINEKLTEHFIEGLKRKGFEFKTREELENFIKSNCKCEDNVHLKQRKYFVNDIPFFIHYYEVDMNINWDSNDSIKSVSYGNYRYL